MTSMAYELHKLHPLKGAGSLGATSPIGGFLDDLFGGRMAIFEVAGSTPDHGAEC